MKIELCGREIADLIIGLAYLLRYSSNQTERDRYRKLFVKLWKEVPSENLKELKYLYQRVERSIGLPSNDIWEGIE